MVRCLRTPNFSGIATGGRAATVLNLADELSAGYYLSRFVQAFANELREFVDRVGRWAENCGLCINEISLPAKPGLYPLVKMTLRSGFFATS